VVQEASASPTDGLVQPNFRFKAARFLRWRKKQPKKKTKFVRYWQSRKPVP
jgi:hypothetical protein